MDPATAAALTDDAAKRAALIWVRRAGSDAVARPLWHAWIDGAGYVLVGGAEQRSPEGLAAATDAEVTVASKDTRARLIGFNATVERVAPNTPEWDAVVPILRARRLNLPDGHLAPLRWAAESTLLRLRPTGTYVE